jgi:hypothetical protein
MKSDRILIMCSNVLMESDIGFSNQSLMRSIMFNHVSNMTFLNKMYLILLANLKIR